MGHSSNRENPWLALAGNQRFSRLFVGDGTRGDVLQEPTPESKQNQLPRIGGLDGRFGGYGGGLPFPQGPGVKIQIQATNPNHQLRVTVISRDHLGGKRTNRYFAGLGFLADLGRRSLRSTCKVATPAPRRPDPNGRADPPAERVTCAGVSLTLGKLLDRWLSRKHGYGRPVITPTI